VAHVAYCRAGFDLGDQSFEHLVLGELALLDHHCFVQHGIGVGVGCLGPSVRCGGQDVLAEMMTDSRTSCRNVCDIQETSVTALPEAIAEGRLTNASAAKAYAHHIVPTPVVTLTANHRLNRAARLPCGSWSTNPGRRHRRPQLLLRPAMRHVLLDRIISHRGIFPHPLLDRAPGPRCGWTCLPELHAQG
jgi:hypothetical protein